jgi:hypothetical protein
VTEFDISDQLRHRKSALTGRQYNRVQETQPGTGENVMFKWLTIIGAAVFFAGEPTLQALVNAGPTRDYAMALVVALMLQPWVAAQFK